MKTGCTSGKKNFVFTFHSVCTVFVPFKMEHFQSVLIIRDLHNFKVIPYEFHMDENRHKRIDAELSFPLYLWAFERDEVQWRYKKAV